MWGQCPRPCPKGIQLMTAELKRYSSRLRDVRTVVSQLGQFQNTQSAAADRRQSSAGKALPTCYVYSPPSHSQSHVAKGHLGFLPLVT